MPLLRYVQASRQIAHGWAFKKFSTRMAGLRAHVRTTARTDHCEIKPMPRHIEFRFLLAAILFLAYSSARCADRQDDWSVVSQQLASIAASTDFTPGGTQPGLAFPILGPSNCAGCHAPNSSSPAFASTYMPHPTWSGSMMANATRDPLFWAALDVANHDVPGVGDFCLRCHTTKGWAEGRVVKNGQGGSNDVTLGAAGCLLLGNYAKADDDTNDFSGVACHYCHRIKPQLQPVGNGVAVIDDVACPGGTEPCRHGPYFYDGMFTPPHAHVQDLGFEKSAFCGTCHNVSSPSTATSAAVKTLILNDGTNTGHPFPVERTFAEWQQSYYARTDALFRDGFQGANFPAKDDAIASCQNCHMPDSGVLSAKASNFSNSPDRTDNLPVHEFAGGNTWVPRILKGEFFANDATRSAALDQTASRATALLESSADLKLQLVSFVAPGATSAGSLKVQATVTNLTGHKLPTGYGEGRRMWLNLRVLDKVSGKLVFESAAYDPSTGVLTRDASARVYETLQGIFNRNGTGACDADSGGVEFFHFVLNDCIAKDTRIPPLGFHPATAADPNGFDLRPVGIAYPETLPGSGELVNRDTPSYSIVLPAGTAASLTVNATLVYQTSSKEYIEFLAREAVLNGTPSENLMCAAGPGRPYSVGPQNRSRGQYLHELWDSPTGYGRSPPVDIRHATLSVQ
jgi:hypothetical protein